MDPVRATDAPPDLPGLRLRERLGEGGSSRVWRAEDEEGRDVAVKVLRPDAPPELRERLREAAPALAKLRHPALVRTLAVGEARGRMYQVMERVEGETLRARVRRDGPLSEAEARDLAVQVAEGLRAAARGGLVHGDVEPGNLVLEPSGRVRILDLGPASGPFGTPAFLAPERARGAPPDERGDLYALGLVLYFAVTGEVPYPVDDVATALRRQAEAPLPDPREKRGGLSGEFVALLRRLAAKDPDDRPRSWSEALGEMRGGWLRAIEIRLGGPVRLAVLGVLLLALTATGIRLALGPRGAPPPVLDEAREAEARGALDELLRTLEPLEESPEVSFRALLALADRFPGTRASREARVAAVRLEEELDRRRVRRLDEAAARARALAAKGSFDAAVGALEAVREGLRETRQESSLDAEIERIRGLADAWRQELEQRVAARLESGDVEGARKILREAPRERTGRLGEWVEHRLAELDLETAPPEDR
jgi:hypothetical protein